MFKKYDSIYVYGYNNWGRNVYNKIKELYPQKEVVILVSKHNKNTKEAKRYKKVLELQEMNPSKRSVVVIGVSPLNRDKLKEKLKSCGFEEIVSYNHEMDDYINNSLCELPKLEVRSMLICVGQACNLKCKDCANFAPYAHKDNTRYPIENIKSDFDKTISYFKEIDTLQIQGGEPFLYKDLSELLWYIKKYNHIFKKIQIATNGTVLPTEEMLHAMKALGVSVRVSNYPLETKVEELCTVLSKMKIDYTVYNFVNKSGEWSDAGAMDYTIPKEKDVVLQVFNCAWNQCFTIENGLIGRCARSIPALTLQNLRKRDLDYINLRKDIDVKKFQKYFIFTSPMECCLHCKGSEGEPIKPAIQIQR